MLPPFALLHGLGHGHIMVTLHTRGSVVFLTPSCVRLQLALGCEACIQKCECEERKNTTHPSHVRGHPACPSRHPRTVHPSPKPKVWQVGGGGMQCSRHHHATWAWASGCVPSCRRR